MSLEIYRQLVNREDDLLNTRTSNFLVWQSVLMAALALGDAAPAIAVLICVLGLALSCIWLYMGYYGHRVTEHYWGKLKALEAPLPTEDRIFTEAHKFRREEISWRVISIHRCLAFVFPILWTLTWLAACIMKLFGALTMGST
ncbi:MAG: hypothetical protein GY856_24370 [bacterium]|nr:hypothetical protein [bacterium]